MTSDGDVSIRPGPSNAHQQTRQFAESALERSKQEGLLLAVRARWIALAIVAVMLPFLNPNWDVLYYIFLIGLFALIGWAQLRFGAVGVSRVELFLMFCDLFLMTAICVLPNPINPHDWPAAVSFRFGNFIYFFVFLAGATLAYSWRTIVAMGTWTTGLWIVGVFWVYMQPATHLELTEALRKATGSDLRLFYLFDPNNANFGNRAQEIIVFFIVACTLAIAARRANKLLVSHAEVERERTNLARYFSPNVAAELAINDEPLKQVRTQNVAVLFVDIIGFTEFADGKSPEAVITTLREFHGQMEGLVFHHSGTLDKYLGDGLMATFGTPFSGDRDALNALRCTSDMIVTLDTWNEKRRSAGEPVIQASFGLHFGPVVLGDIGANRLEFAVIGSTVNVASRLEAMTRQMDCVLVASSQLINQARMEQGSSESDFTHLSDGGDQTVRGIEHPIPVWTRSRG
jgi:adenylate cyclase